ncbi:MAG TPA: hypothetical protein VJ385_00345 [Fibrobacteria bacterium]|nr:hypothetical protein [Fibrobacteria bacterium]
MPALLLMGLSAGGAAQAAEIFVEAEAARMGDGGKITTPLLIKDDNLASDGSYVEVIGGNNSNDAMPAAEGVLSLVFEQPDASASYTIWARVIAPTASDDSFWLRMDGGTPIKWNNIPLGTAWHWVRIKAEGASAAAKFTLSTGTHTLKFAYREDGTKLDQLILTSNANYNPNATLSGPPLAPRLSTNYRASSEAGSLLSWSEVPGGVTYTLVQVTSTGETPLVTGKGHARIVSGDGGDFYVVAKAPNGTSASSETVTVFSTPYFYDAYRSPFSTMSVTSPMGPIGSFGASLYVDPDAGVPSSLNSAPAHGRGRYDFRVAVATDISVYGEVGAPNTGSDSYWVRMDQGPWVKWNNIPDFTCSPVRNSDAGNAIMTYHLNTGSHFLEFAYREVGTSLGRFGLTSSSGVFSPCED